MAGSGLEHRPEPHRAGCRLFDEFEVVHLLFMTGFQACSIFLPFPEQTFDNSPVGANALPFDVRNVKGEAAILFDHMAAQNYEGASIFWLRSMAALGGEDAAIRPRQVTRDGRKRGIVEVVQDDTK